MIQAIERYMKQAIVDHNPAIASAALVSALVCTSSSFCLPRTGDYGWSNSLLLLLFLSISLFLSLFSQHMFRRGSSDIVKRWVNEAQEGLSSDNVMVQVTKMDVVYLIMCLFTLCLSHA